MPLCFCIFPQLSARVKHLSVKANCVFKMIHYVFLLLQFLFSSCMHLYCFVLIAHYGIHPAYTSTVCPLCVLVCVFSQIHHSVLCGTDSWKLLIEGRKSKQRRGERKQARGRRAERRGWRIKAVQHYELLNHTRLTHTD